MKSLISEYNRKKCMIKRRLKEFSTLYKGGEVAIFPELCFCLLTPQSKAIYCDKAIKELKRSGLLLKGRKNAVKAKLKAVRFPNNKAAYLIAARRRFKKNELDAKDTFKARDWLVKNIKGLGYKEASHFLRNIGLGKDMAILDVHILRNLKRYGIIKRISASISRKKYVDIENKMREFSKKIKIPLEELDLLFWSRETGIIFK